MVMNTLDRDSSSAEQPHRRLPAPNVRQGRRVTMMVIAGILIGGLAGFGMLAFHFIEATDRPMARDLAEDFVRFVCLGEAGDPTDGEDPEALCGYAKAYDLLAEELRATLAYGAFCEEFEVISERSGAVQRLDLRSARRARQRRPGFYSYELSLGHEDASLEDLKQYSLELWVAWADSNWVVTRFSIQPASQREMR